MAVGVVAYELFSQVHEVREDDETKSIGGFNQPHRLTVGERAALIDDVVAARRAVDVFADVDAEEDVIFAEKERRAITAVLSSGPIATRDATPIFMLARRARALARLADPNALVADAARAYARANGGAVPSTKSLNAYIRETLGISLTKRELERAAALVRDDLPP